MGALFTKTSAAAAESGETNVSAVTAAATPQQQPRQQESSTSTGVDLMDPRSPQNQRTPIPHHDPKVNLNDPRSPQADRTPLQHQQQQQDQDQVPQEQASPAVSTSERAIEQPTTPVAATTLFATTTPVPTPTPTPTANKSGRPSSGLVVFYDPDALSSPDVTVSTSAPLAMHTMHTPSSVTRPSTDTENLRKSTALRNAGLANKRASDKGFGGGGSPVGSPRAALAVWNGGDKFFA